MSGNDRDNSADPASGTPLAVSQSPAGGPIAPSPRGEGRGEGTSAPPCPAPAGSYVLPLPGGQDGAAASREAGDPYSGPLLLANVLWFCRFRWAIIGVFALFGVVGWIPGLAGALALRPPGLWPFEAAAVLLVGNVLFLIHARSLSRQRRPLPDGEPAARGQPAIPDRARFNLWSQIIQDLLVATVAIHFLGSTNTYALFVYLFHIVLACIFFLPRQSLIVTVLAIGMYAGCVALEQTGLAPPQTVFVMPAGPRPIAPATMVNFVSAIAIWLVVWYLASHLSGMVHQRDADLAASNRRLVAAQSERSRHMLTTTHQLKAPFAAIDANVQLLLSGLCGPLPEDAMLIAGRIAARCRRLAREIQEMLQLANLDSDGQPPPPMTELDLAEELRWSIHQLEPTAGQQNIALELDLAPAPAMGTQDHIRMLFANLLSNAVIYSYAGGRVTVTCRGPLGGGQPAGGEAGDRPGGDARPSAGDDDHGGAVVVISDQGIGIAAEKLPHIFEEHYRTNEAVQHNKESSGLGLAIVRQVAQRHGIRLAVRSQPGAGTTFELRFPEMPGDGRETVAQPARDS